MMFTPRYDRNLQSDLYCVRRMLVNEHASARKRKASNYNRNGNSNNNHNSRNRPNTPLSDIQVILKHSLSMLPKDRRSPKCEIPSTAARQTLNNKQPNKQQQKKNNKKKHENKNNNSNHNIPAETLRCNPGAVVRGPFDMLHNGFLGA